MDEEGFVPISLFASFHKVARLSSVPRVIQEALSESKTLEMRDDKVRSKDDWKKWLLPKDFVVPGYSTDDDGASNSESELDNNPNSQGKKKAPRRSSVRKSSVSDNGDLFEFDEEQDRKGQGYYMSSDAESEDEPLSEVDDDFVAKLVIVTPRGKKTDKTGQQLLDGTCAS